MQHDMVILTRISLMVVTLMSFSPAWAERMYRTVERDGTVSFTNVPTDTKYRPVRPTRSPRTPRAAAHELAPAVVRHASVHELDPALVWAVMKAESDFNPNAVSSAGAMGLMQLMPETAMRLKVDPLDPEDNIAGGTRYLRYLLDRFNGDLPRALAAYNAGATRVEASRRLPAIQETQDYVRKVLRFYRLFAKSPGRMPAHGSPITLSRSPR